MEPLTGSFAGAGFAGMFWTWKKNNIHGYHHIKKSGKILSMHGWVLAIIILLSSIPVFAVYIWFRLAKYEFSLAWFLFALLSGAAGFFPALFLQYLLNFSFSGGRAVLFYEIIIRLAFTEELSRLLMLLLFFWVCRRFTPDSPLSLNRETGEQPSKNDIKKGAAAGLIAGLGFAVLENSIFGSSDFNLLLIRTFTAALLHAACGSRVGIAAIMLRTNPFQAILRILVATAIHGVYNLMILLGGFMSILAIFVAIFALASSVLAIRGGWSSGENSEIT